MFRPIAKLFLHIGPRLVEFAEQAHENNIQVIIAGAGGSAHLPGMLAAHTHLLYSVYHSIACPQWYG